MAYSRGQVDGLQEWRESYSGKKKSQVHSVIQYLVEMRIAVRTLQPCASPKPRCDDELWQGEMAFVEAMYFETQNDDGKAKELYLQAQRLLYKNSARKKAACSYHNAIACMSRLEPERRFIPEYQEAIRFGKEADDQFVVAIALNNLSREFHLMKAPRLALQYSDQAVELLRQHANGTYSFYLAICHRCQLNLELGCLQAAALDFEEASCSIFPEVKDSVNVLRKWMADKNIALFSDGKVEADVASLPTWSERKRAGLQEIRGNDAFSDLQCQLIELLASGPKDSFELVQALWGDRESFFHLENRLKQLIFRLRKKRPNLIGYSAGKYSLLDVVRS